MEASREASAGLSWKKYHISNSVAACWPLIVEKICEELSLFTWSSANILATYVWCNTESFIEKSVLELGAGTALPSIVAGLCGARSVVITERAEPETIDVIRSTVSMNKLGSICTVQALDWGSTCVGGTVEEVDVILGADLFYSSEHFDSILQTVAAILSRNSNAVFITAYQERCNRRSLNPYLEKFNLCAEVVTNSSFLHSAHHRRECVVEVTPLEVRDFSQRDSHGGFKPHKKRRRSSSNSELLQSNKAVKTQSLNNFDNISVIKITHKSKK